MHIFSAHFGLPTPLQRCKRTSLSTPTSFLMEEKKLIGMDSHNAYPGYICPSIKMANSYHLSTTLLWPVPTHYHSLAPETQERGRPHMGFIFRLCVLSNKREKQQTKVNTRLCMKVSTKFKRAVNALKLCCMERQAEAGWLTPAHIVSKTEQVSSILLTSLNSALQATAGGDYGGEELVITAMQCDNMDIMACLDSQTLILSQFLTTK